jgi:ribosomal protein L15E
VFLLILQHLDMINKDNSKLGQWVSTQRQGYRHYKAGNKQKSEGMCEERIKNLESIGFNWVSEHASKQHTWDEIFEELRLFKTKHGHANVPQTKDADNLKLGRWIHNQRQGYKNCKAGNKQKSRGICEERINKLENIDFKWTII